ncbi:hypothetical protein SFA33_24160 [Escherichia coli]|nr:hypothetical protein [Escherichia coli]MDX1861116.1 hypothetical protein [Escherichia coli]
MNQYIASYIEKMASFSTVLSETVSLANEYWHPETPPVVMLFSQVGKTIVKNFYEMGDIEREKYLNMSKMVWFRLMMNWPQL